MEKLKSVNILDHTSTIVLGTSCRIFLGKNKRSYLFILRSKRIKLPGLIFFFDDCNQMSFP